MRWARLLVIPLVLSTAPTALAQGCVMCYTSAASQGPKALHSLNLGILALLIPVLLLFLGVLGFAYWRARALRSADAVSAGRITGWDAPFPLSDGTELFHPLWEKGDSVIPPRL